MSLPEPNPNQEHVALDPSWPYGSTPVFKPLTPLEAEALKRAVAEADPNGLDPHQPGAKLDAGKCKAAVLADFALALKAVADVGTYGADKYTRGGWQNVPDGVVRYSDALWRHLLAARHEPHDRDTGLKHLAHAAWNILAILELEARGGQQT